jgi:hypothetical protein
MTQELIDETHAILCEGGAQEMLVRQDACGGWLVAFGFEPGVRSLANHTSQEICPHDDPRELARMMLAEWRERWAPKPTVSAVFDSGIAVDSGPPQVWPEEVVQALEEQAMGAQPININVSPVFNVTGGNASNDAEARAIREAEALFGDSDGRPQNESTGHDAKLAGEIDAGSGGTDSSGIHHADEAVAQGGDDAVGDAANGGDDAGGSGEDVPVEAESVTDESLNEPPESPPADEPAEAIADFVDSGADAIAEGDEGSAEERAAGGGLQVLHGDGQDGTGDSDVPYALDADYEEITDADALELIEEEGRTLPLHIEHSAEDDFLPPPKSDDTPPPQDRFIGLDDLDRRRSLRIGDVAVIAERKLEAIAEQVAEQPDEYANMQSHVTTHLDKHTGLFRGEQPVYDRFMVLEDGKARGGAIDRERVAKTHYLMFASREEVERFDPEANWPE